LKKDIKNIRARGKSNKKFFGSLIRNRLKEKEKEHEKH